VPRVISTKTELVIAGAVLVAGLSGWAAQSAFADPPLTAAQVAAAIGCATVDTMHTDPDARETTVCQLDGHHRVTIVTFDDRRQRDGWMMRTHSELAMSRDVRALVIGDGWALVTDDLAAARRMAVKVHAWWA
jgi:hypothetical protein